MEVLPLIRLLWRRRLLVVLGLVGALALGFVAGGGDQATSVAAQARVIFDTPKSQLVQNAPFGAESLPWRAGLIAHLTATKETQRRIAARLGIAPDELAVVDPELAFPKVSASLPKAAAEVAAIVPKPYVLSVQLERDGLPLVSLVAFAPDRTEAARLAEAGVAVLKEAAPPREAVRHVPLAVAESEAGNANPGFLQGFVVEEVGSVRFTTITQTELPLKAIGATVLGFGLWCAFVIVGPLVSRFRQRRAVLAG